MFNFSLDYMTADRRGQMTLHQASEQDLIEFFNIFGTVDGKQIRTEAPLHASAELKAKVAAFCDARKGHVPQLGAFRKLIDDLSPNEAFLILPSQPRSSAVTVKLEALVA